VFRHLFGMTFDQMLDLDLDQWSRYRAYADKILGVGDG
jgi:hypothetical protein